MEAAGSGGCVGGVDACGLASGGGGAGQQPFASLTAAAIRAGAKRPVPHPDPASAAAIADAVAYELAHAGIKRPAERDVGADAAAEAGGGGEEGDGGCTSAMGSGGSSRRVRACDGARARARVHCRRRHHRLRMLR